MTLDELANEAPKDFRRDQWGRPSILQPDGKRKGYTRCSSAAKTIEDTFNLEKWARRNIAYGMAYDASLVARVIAIGGEPSTWKKPEKDQVNEILEAADAVAKAHKSADIGTAVHHLTHRLDRGEEVIAGPYQADLDAYQTAMRAAGLEIDRRYIECHMVNDVLQMAGSTDRIVKVIQHNGRTTQVIYRIADVKTGQTVDYGGLGWTAQIAAYAGGLIYDVDTDQRVETPPIDQTVGYIIHLPAGQGRCDIYTVDLVAGHRAAELANEIRTVRKESKSWITKVAAPVGSPGGERPSTGEPAISPVDNIEEKVQALTEKFDAIGRRKMLRHRYDLLNDEQKADYTARKQAIDTNDLDAVERLLDEVEPFNIVVEPVLDYYSAGFLYTSDGSTTRTINEGPPVDDATIAALQREFERLSDEAKFWIATLTAQGRKAGVDWRPNAKPTVRRYELARGIVRLAVSPEREWFDRNDIIRGLAYTACSREEVTQEFLPLGAALGTLNAAEAARFAQLVDDYVSTGSAA